MGRALHTPSLQARHKAKYHRTQRKMTTTFYISLIQRISEEHHGPHEKFTECRTGKHSNHTRTGSGITETMTDNSDGGNTGTQKQYQKVVSWEERQQLPLNY